jgi:hypothetical protein
LLLPIERSSLPVFTLYVAGGAEIHGKPSITSTRRMTEVRCFYCVLFLKMLLVNLFCVYKNDNGNLKNRKLCLRLSATKNTSC